MFSGFAHLQSWCCVKHIRIPSLSRKLSAQAHTQAHTQDVITKARSYCSNLLQDFDSSSYTLQTFIPETARDAYLAIRAFNVELARIPDIVSNSSIGALRMQFWRDSVEKTFAGTPSHEPVAILLHHALSSLQVRKPGVSVNTMKAWFLKIIKARNQYMDNQPYTDMAALETYAENTYSTLMYLTLASLPLQSMAADHLVSHIGKATGIATVLRGLPLIAFPPPVNHHGNRTILGGDVGQYMGSRQGAVLIPLDIMAESGVREEDVFRKGGEAHGLKDAVFRVATRANDHLLTAKEMLRDLQRGDSIGHDFEHQEGHNYDSTSSNETMHPQDLKKVLGVFMPAVSTKLWLEKLEKYDFDVFNPQMRVRDWKLPWKAYWAYSRRFI